jgi:hypothetical protein
VAYRLSQIIEAIAHLNDILLIRAALPTVVDSSGGFESNRTNELKNQDTPPVSLLPTKTTGSTGLFGLQHKLRI